MGQLVDRTHRELTDSDLRRIADTYHAWRGDEGARKYEDISGFCKSATRDEISTRGYVLAPARYVGALETEEDDMPFEEKMKQLTGKLETEFSQAASLEKAIRENLKAVGYAL